MSFRQAKTKTRLSVQPLENRLFLTAIGVADADAIREPANDISVDEIAIIASTDGSSGEDLLIVNNGDGSDFVEVGRGGGPHVKVFDGNSNANDEVDAIFSEVGRETADAGYNDQFEVLSFSWGEDGASTDAVPADQFSINFAKIEY